MTIDGASRRPVIASAMNALMIRVCREIWKYLSTSTSLLAQGQQHRAGCRVSIGHWSRGRHLDHREIVQYRVERYAGLPVRRGPLVGNERDIVAFLNPVIRQRCRMRHELFKAVGV